jgi:glycosyltransferase involved in cell wall biosynthesis
MHDVVGRMEEILSIYHIVDEYGGYTGANSSDVLDARENRLLDRVDLSIAVSPELIAARESPARRLVLVENAVDYERFVDAGQSGTDPAAMAAIPRPRYGYSGLIGVRLDLELLIELARAEPDCSLVLAGKVDPRNCEAALAALRATPNVHFLGQVDVADVPKYVAGFDVGLLPYRINRETRHISPLKLYEYLAAGKPVVGTRIPAAERHEDLVALADDPTGFVAATRRVLAGDDAAARQQRRAFAAQNTWDHRVREIAEALRPLLAAATTPGP